MMLNGRFCSAARGNRRRSISMGRRFDCRHRLLLGFDGYFQAAGFSRSPIDIGSLYE
jgi:hypothetical protein